MKFGSSDVIGTREALFFLHVLTVACRNMDVDMYVYFVNFQRASDYVNHQKMIEILKITDIDNKDYDLYQNYTGTQQQTST